MDMCYLACAYRTPSGYCGSTGGVATCPHRQKKQTNADRVRAMSDEELAEFMWSGCDNITQEACKRHAGCVGCWLDWLQEEVDDG